MFTIINPIKLEEYPRNEISIKRGNIKEIYKNQIEYKENHAKENQKIPQYQWMIHTEYIWEGDTIIQKRGGIVNMGMIRIKKNDLDSIRGMGSYIVQLEMYGLHHHQNPYEINKPFSKEDLNPSEILKFIHRGIKRFLIIRGI